MLLWISAAGLAGAGWLGWLIWRDYDWAGTPEQAYRPSHSSAIQRRTHAQPGSSPSGNVTNDLLGSTQTDWAAGSGSATNSQITDGELVINIDDTHVQLESESSDSLTTEETETEPDAVRQDAAQPNAARRDAAHEDFVVIRTSPALAQNRVTTVRRDAAHEDFVVIDEPGKELDDELPEIDLADYMTQWTPIIPKIAALITHELWPQLRSYLESLPQFGDMNLERVVNAVAEDAVLNREDTDRGGEEDNVGFAFYANLFEEMENSAEPVDVAPEEADLVMA